ncbi:MAG: nucleotidyltransferase domain-containing protein [Pedosphaera sp.]|nr:nucleotidyltransferase domain-containing protein [Pedosphaera sp.]
MSKRRETPKLAELGALFRTFCQKHRIRRLDVFGSVAPGQMTAVSDLDLLVTPDEINPPSTTELLEMTGEAEELAGTPVDFVLRPSLEKSANRFAREHILATAVCVHGS